MTACETCQQRVRLCVQRFEFVLAPSSNLAVRSILKRRLNALPPGLQKTVTALEVSAQAMAVAEAVALRIDRDGGFGLFVDYGQETISGHPQPADPTADRNLAQDPVIVGRSDHPDAGVYRKPRRGHGDLHR